MRTVNQIVICEWCGDVLDDGTERQPDVPRVSALLAACPKSACKKAAADAETRLDLLLEAAS